MTSREMRTTEKITRQEQMCAVNSSVRRQQQEDETVVAKIGVQRKELQECQWYQNAFLHQKQSGNSLLNKQETAQTQNPKTSEISGFLSVFF